MVKDVYGNTRFYGIYRGVVADNRDPQGLLRLKLQIPQVLSDATTEWAWPINTPYLVTPPPAVGQGVWVAFEGGDPQFPIWLGVFGPEQNTVLLSSIKAIVDAQ